MRLRQAIRAASPAPLRHGVALTRRALRDSGLGKGRPLFATLRGEAGAADHLVIQVVQPIRSGAFGEGKRANIRLGAERLDGIVIAPGELLSFWKIVGRPTERAGFALGRSIRGGAVGGDIGGGLCQLSGIVYEAGLRAGLDVAERHPHSRDLYAEDERFTPLGMDATVVWPYKDLRLRNGLGVSVRIAIRTDGAHLTAEIRAAAPLEPREIDITRTDRGVWRDVVVRRRCPQGTLRAVSHDSYQALEAGPA